MKRREAHQGAQQLRTPSGKSRPNKVSSSPVIPLQRGWEGGQDSRETIVGLVKALEIYIASDKETEFKEWIHWANFFVKELGSISGVEAGITYQRVVEDGEPMTPFCYLILDESVCGISGRELENRLQKGKMRIHTLWEPTFLLGSGCKGMMIINPEYMLEGEHEVVVKSIKEILKN